MLAVNYCKKQIQENAISKIVSLRPDQDQHKNPRPRTKLVRLRPQPKPYSVDQRLVLL